MKKLLAGILTLSLALAACSNGDDGSGSKDDSKKDKSSRTDKAKASNKDNKKSNDGNSNSDKDNGSKSKDSNSADNASAKDKDQSANESSSNSNALTSNSNGDDNSNSNENMRGSNDGNAGSQNRSDNHDANGEYVVPYQGQNAVPVAQNIAWSNDNSQQALRNLPNFQTSLDQATNEVNGINDQSNPYNDFAVEGSNGNYSYIFSFQNNAQPGSYTIATVDQQGTVRIVDPAYRQ